MEYLAHIEGERRQSVKDHLYGTAELAEILQNVLERENGDIVAGCFTTLESTRTRFRNGSRIMTTGWWTTLQRGQKYAWIRVDTIAF